MDWFNPFEGSEGGGGGSGTDNYNELINKPSINNVVLSGNKTEDDLGLQKKISSNNKISSDNVSDLGAQNLFTNATEKQNWNAKQDAIQNLQDIQSGAAAGATAVQTISINGVQQTKNNGNIDLPAYPTTLPASDTTNLYDPNGTSPISGKGVAAAIGTLDVAAVGGAGKYISEISETNGKISATPTTMDTSLSNSSTNNNCPTSKTVYDDQQRQDAALVEVENKGAKNRLPLTGESTDIFTINADGTMTANGSSSTSKRDFAYYIGAPPKGRFVFSGCPPTGSNTTYRMFLQSVVGSTYTTLATLTGDPVEVDLTDIDKIRVLMSIYAGYTPNNIKFSPMLCTKAEWDISHTYVPYGKTNAELTVENASQQSEINYAVNTGAKNIFDIQATSTVQRTTTVLNPDGGITISCNAAVWATRNVTAEIPAGDYICSLFVDAVTIVGGVFAFFVNQSNDKSTWTELARQTPITSTGRIDMPISVSQKYLRITTNINNSDTSATNSATIRLMLRPAEITDTTFQPYADTNPVLTQEVNWNVNNGVKNLFDINETPIVNHTTYTLTDEKLTVIANGTWAHYSVPIDLPAGNYILSLIISDYSKASGAPDTSMRMRLANTTSGIEYLLLKTITGNGTMIVPFTWDGGKLYIQFYPNFNATSYANSFSAADVMIRPASITDDTFVPYALPNPTLTPAAIKAVDEGAKNLVQLGFTSTSGSSSVPATTNNNDGTITVNGSRVGNATILVQDLITAQTSSVNTRYTLPAGNYVIAPTGNENIGLQVYKHDGTNQVGLGNARTEALTFTYSDTDKVQYPYICIRLYCEGNFTINNFTFMPMVCTAADWNVSQKFVPYAPTNRELYETKATVDDIFGVKASLTAGTDLNDITTPGKYTCGGATAAAQLLHCPTTTNGFIMFVDYVASELRIIQRIYSYNTTSGAFEVFYRSYISTGWTDWQRGLTDATLDEIPTANSTKAVMSGGVQAPLEEVIDNGAKNLCNWSASTSTIEHVTFTINDDKTVSTSGTATARSQEPLFFTVPSTLKTGRYVLSGCPSGGEQSGKILYCLYLWDTTANARVASGNDTGNGLEFDWIPDASHTYNISVDVRNGTNATGLIFKPMICTAEDWAVSQKFVPYCPTNRELYEEKIGIEDAFGSGTNIVTNGTADITEIGNFYCKNAETAATVTNAPWTDSGFFGFVRRSISPSGRFIQIAFKNSDTMAIAKRRYIGTWQPWSYIDTYDEGNLIPDNANLNDYTRGGKYYGGNSAGNSVSNLPVENASFNFSLEVKNASPVHTLQYLTILRTTDDPYIYKRRYYNGAWGSWYKFEGTEVTS